MIAKRKRGKSDLAACESRLVFHQLALRAHLPHSYTQVPTSANGSALHPCEVVSREGGKEEREIKRQKERKTTGSLVGLPREFQGKSRMALNRQTTKKRN